MIMRKIYLKLSFLLLWGGTFHSCTTINEELMYDIIGNDTPIGEETHFNPPSWILGKWKDDDTTTDYYYEFESKNIKEKISDLNIIDYNELINESLDFPLQALSVEEIVISTTVYEFKIESADGTFNHYRFTKESSDQMLRTIVMPDGEPEILTEFTRVQ